MSDSRETTEDSASKALACATAIRIGGALYILTEASGLEDIYYGVDDGIQAGMIALARRRELDRDVVRSAMDDCSLLSTRYPASASASAFFGSGILVMRMVLELIGEDPTDCFPQRINEKAQEAAGYWPMLIDAGGWPSLAEFEADCQNRAVNVLEHGGARALREEAGKHALVYRRAAQALC